MKTKILADFQICTSVPLKSDSHLSKKNSFFASVKALYK